jgi:polysaccharide biosynthesis/export protein
MLRIQAFVLLFALCGCSDLVPGLNLSEGKGGTHQYEVVRNKDEANKYKVVQAEPMPEYQVVAITPDLLLNMAKQQGAADALATGPSLLPSDVPPEYRLGPGDIFFVVVWDHPELTAPYTGLTNDLSSQGRLVAADGTAFFPYVGIFKAQGMTAADLRKYLAEHLRSVIQNPQVDVRVVAYRADRFEITGEVGKPGTYYFDDTPKGVLQAIDGAGGLTAAASRRRVILVRDGVAHVIDIAGLLSGNKLVANPELKPGDVLHVPDLSGDEVFVLGSVNRQAPVTLSQDPKTLAQVLTEAGGLDATKGKESGILVFRPQLAPDSKVSATVFTLDMSRPEGMLLASQFQVEPRDVVYVKATAFYQYNSVVNELVPTITSAYQIFLIKCYSHSGLAC